MYKVVDARGRSCPEPVLMVKDTLVRYNQPIKVLVDTMVAVENVKRFSRNQGFNAEHAENDGEYSVIIKK